MINRKHDGNGFAAVETLLVIIFIAMVGFVGWYVFHTKQQADKNLQAAGNASQTPVQAGDGGNQGLQQDLNGINTANNQTTKDLNAADNGLDDNSTFTSLP